MKRFTSLETIVAGVFLAVGVAVCSAAAYPHYKDSVRASARVDAQAMLAQMNDQAVAYYKDNGNYRDFIPTAPSSSRYAYVAVSTPDTYRMTALPINDQERDVCGELTINSMGQHMQSRPQPRNALHRCWN